MRTHKMQNLLIYITVALVVIGIGYFVLKFPSGAIIHLFSPAVTQADLAEKPHKDFSGLKASENIPRIIRMSQYEDGTYTGLNFVTVETSVIIPMDAYRLKDPADINTTDMYLGRGRAFSGAALEEYTTYPLRRTYLYGRYYILGLSDGSYVAVYTDQSYGGLSLLGQKVTFPIGRLTMASTQEKKWLKEAGSEYPMDTEKILYMINDNNVSDLNFLDMIIRVTAAVIFIVSILGILLFKFKKKR